MARRRRKRRSSEVKGSFKLGLVLLGLVGINVYVFFFNHGTAPREVLNLQSTSKTMDATRKELLANDARTARPLVTGPAAPETTAQGTAVAVNAAPPEPARPAAPRPAPPVVLAAANTTGSPVIRIPFAPPPELSEPASDASRARGAVPPHAPYQIPFAPPPEEEDAPAEAVEKKFADADTLGQVLTREGFGAAGPQVTAALAKLVDPRTIRGGQKYLVRAGDDGTPDAFEYQPSPVLRFVVERDGEEGAFRWTARKLAADVEIRTVEAAGIVESSLYESVQKAGESTVLVSLLVELLAWDVNFYVDTHPGDHWKVIVEKQYLSGPVLQVRPAAGRGVRRQGRHLPLLLLGRQAAPLAIARASYYDEQGQAISKTMLKTPLRFVRISSKFDRKRLHPILHVEKAHLGDRLRRARRARRSGPRPAAASSRRA